MKVRTWILFGIGFAIVLTGTVWAQDEEEMVKHVTISTRNVGEYFPNLDNNTQGPAPGDVAMQILLQNNGISARVVPDNLFYDVFGDTYVNNETGEEVNIDLAILSGSSGSSDVPDVGPLFEKGIPIMMGEHVCLAERSDRPGSIKMYLGDDSHTDLRTTEIRRIRIVNNDHPITQGIETDADGWVQVFRDPAPGEGVFEGWVDTQPKQIIPRGGLYDNRVCLGQLSLKADGTEVLAEIDPEIAPDPDMVVCLAVLDQGAELADGTASNSRLVHWLTNEEGSGGPHRNFMALNETGRLLFVRACRWAMGMEVDTPVNDYPLY